MTDWSGGVHWVASSTLLYGLKWNYDWPSAILEQMMWYTLLADALLILHFLWIIFLILGLPLGFYFRMRRLRIVHAFGLLFALALQIGGILCPLTIWEESLRRMQQPDFSYRGSFIIAYIEKLVYPGWISMQTLTVLTVLLVLLTLLSFILKPPWQKTASRSD